MPILKQAPDDLEFQPERDLQKFMKVEKDRKDARACMIDGTERRRQRPKKAEEQAVHYSSKKKVWSDRNIVIACGLHDLRVDQRRKPLPL